jgi:hypothetical protein
VVLLLTDAMNPVLTQSVIVSNKFVEDDEESYEIDTSDGAIKLFLLHVLMGKQYPLSAPVTEAEAHENPRSEHLRDDAEVFRTPGLPFGRLTVDIRATCGSVRSRTLLVNPSYCSNQTPGTRVVSTFNPLGKR